ncbi:protein TIFY 8 isoform X2 [Cryptomeria japonica]|uniref:protein TIFY 8 isoform X2 n=1 Tax=Cryptomeria japonica TaxID=3369 RepID=UPI0027D9E859|nr:protein TIFY 8 isoform X2 [Cryptomeria japonica]
MAGEGQLLFHDFLGTSPNEQKQTEGSLSHISSSTAPSNGRAFEEKNSRILSAKASSATHEWPEVSCSAPPLLAGAFAMTAPSISEPSSERLSWGNSVGLLPRGDRGSFNRQEVDSRSFGKKRDSSTSNSNHLLQDRLQISVDALENSRGSKPPKQTSNCSTLLQSSMHKPDFMAVNKLERPVSLNMAAYGHSHLRQCGGFPDMNYSSASGDITSMPSSLSRPAADEGSRTGLQISNLGSLINNVPSSTPDRSTGMPGISVGRTKFSSQSAGSEPGIPKSHQIAASASRQLTVFYGGQAHVFDDVPPVKADAIMALAGSNGRSWSTTYTPWHKSSERNGLVPGSERQKNEEEIRSGRRGL